MPSKKHEFMQLKNPMSGRYVKIKRGMGLVVSSKKTPYKGIPMGPSDKRIEEWLNECPPSSDDEALNNDQCATKGKKDEYMQLKNPMSGRYVKIIRGMGLVVSSKKTPYKGIPMGGKRER